MRDIRTVHATNEASSKGNTMDRSVNVCNIVRLCNKVCKLRRGRGCRNVTSKMKDDLREISATKLLNCLLKEKLPMFKSLNLPPLPQGNREGVVTPNTSVLKKLEYEKLTFEKFTNLVKSIQVV